MKIDARALANYILDLAERQNIGVTHLSLQKVIYFIVAHGIKKNEEIELNQKFEAWEHGPVLRDLYSIFKICEERPINIRSQKIDFRNGYKSKAELPEDFKRPSWLDEAILFYCRIPASILRNWSHQVGGPWEQVWNHTSKSNPGMLISHESMVRFFRTENAFGQERQ
jgi:uncharacterized phage-associated protein